jgi:hypothetical protein
MAILALIDCYVEINAVDMSAHVKAVELDIEAVDLDTTDFASGGWNERISGLKSGSAKVRFNDDYAATTVDDRIWARFGLVTTLNVRPTAAAASATNPEYQMSVLVNQFRPVGGTVGDLAVKDLTWPITGAITRDVGA